MADTFNAQPHAQTPPHTALSALTLASPEKLYRILYEDSPCMYFMLDHEGTVLAVNRFGAEHLGYAQEELLGRSVLTVFHDEDKPAAQRQLTLVLATPGQAHRWQLRKIRKDGRLLWVEEDARAIRRDDGALIALVLCTDITERKRAEQELREARVFLESIVENIPDMVFVKDARDLRFVRFNKAGEDLIGLPRETLI